MIKNNNTHKIIAMAPGSQSGFSLLELFLVVSITVMALASIFSLIQTGIDDRTDAKAAEQIKELQEAAENYVSLNFTDLLNNNVPGVNALGMVNDIANIPFGVIIAQNFLPAGYTGINIYRQQMAVYARRTNNTASGPVIEVITLTDDLAGGDSRMQTDRIINAANKGGPNVGSVTNLAISATCCAGRAVSSSKTWNVPIAPFAAAGYTGIANANGGYLASYGRVFTPVNPADNNYLFREPVVGIPNFNIMTTDLDMNGNALENAGTLVVDNISMRPGSNITIVGDESNIIDGIYALAVENNFSSNDLIVNNAASLSSDRGNLFIDGDGGTEIEIRANRLVVNNAGGNSAIIANNINDNSTTFNLVINDQINFDTMTSTGTTNINGDFIPDNLIFRNNGFRINDMFQVTEMSGQIDNINTSSATTESLDVSGNSVINAPTEMTRPLVINGNATSSNINAQGLTLISRCREAGGTIPCQ